MTLQNITISTINNTDLYFLKADGSDFIQAPISETPITIENGASEIISIVFESEV